MRPNGRPEDRERTAEGAGSIAPGMRRAKAHRANHVYWRPELGIGGMKAGQWRPLTSLVLLGGRIENRGADTLGFVGYHRRLRKQEARGVSSDQPRGGPRNE